MLLSGNWILHKIVEKFVKPDIYLFTTRINKQLDRYVSWHPETRGNGYQCLLSYLEQQWFLHVPPFSLVGWILVTIYRDKANAMMAVPDWSTHTGTCSCYRWPTRTCCICGCHKEIWHCHTKPPSTTCYAKKKKKM